MIQHVENQWLTWQRATKLVNADFALNGYQTPPERLGNYYPNWFKNLKADVRTYLPQGVGQKNLTARVCLGLRGINNLGWTLKTPWDMDRGGHTNSIPNSYMVHAGPKKTKTVNIFGAFIS